MVREKYNMGWNTVQCLRTLWCSSMYTVSADTDYNTSVTKQIGFRVFLYPSKAFSVW